MLSRPTLSNERWRDAQRDLCGLKEQTTLPLEHFPAEQSRDIENDLQRQTTPTSTTRSSAESMRVDTTDENQYH